MLEKGKIYEFKIIDVGMNFEGIAKTDDGLIVFIPNTLIDEVVKAKIIKVNKSYALGEVKEIAISSIKRKTSNCEYYSMCGGCMARHTTYDNTLDIKKQNVINTLKKQDVDITKLQNIYGMGNPYYYRNKVQYPVRQINGKTVMGMFEMSTHKIVENNYCLIQDKITHEVARRVFDLVLENKLLGYDESNGTGDIRNVMVRRGTHTEEVMVVLVVNSNALSKDQRIQNIANKITKQYADIKSFVINVNDRMTNVILTDNNICIYGNEYITDYIGDYKFKITADSFFQVNTLQAEVLYNVLKERLDLKRDKTMLELYSGVGSIGIFLSSCVKDIYSVEIVESATEAAKENARINNVKNIINVNGDATKETLKLIKEGKFFDYVVVDPPRKGLDLKGIELLLKLKPKKIGYVSCNAATLARDLKLLCANDYNIETIDLVDMFPWTSHVECVVVLKLKESTEI